MKHLLMTSTALVLTAGMAFAQTTTGSGVAPANVSATDNLAATSNQNGGFWNRAMALDSPAGNDEEADARALNGSEGVRSAVNLTGALEAYSGATGGPAIGVLNQPANANLQFQVGTSNQAINLQSGVRQESATLQKGDFNQAIISQRVAGNEAAISQYGDRNNSSIIQNGSDNGAASAQAGNWNSSVMLQTGFDNIVAHAQAGDRNVAMTFQNNGDNTAAQVQVGNLNQSLISQGGGTTNSLAAIDGTTRSVGLPTGLLTSPVLASASSQNSAASIQLGNANRSAIIQQGNNNEAINYQSTP